MKGSGYGEGMSESDRWGYSGDDPPCKHLLALRALLAEQKITIYSEHGEQPAGWVNIYCKQCGLIREDVLHDNYKPLAPAPQEKL